MGNSLSANPFVCDVECQRRSALEKLRVKYNQQLQEYNQLLLTFQSYKSSKLPQDSWKQTYADNTLRPKIETNSEQLSETLSTLRDNINKMEIEMNTLEDKTKRTSINIDRNINFVELQNTEIQNLQNDKLTREKQVEFSKDKLNITKRNLIILIIIDIILVCLVVYLLYTNLSTAVSAISENVSSALYAPITY